MSDERLDRVIDEVARQMTEAELPGDFRARIVERIEGRGPRRTWRAAWILSPIAAAAVVAVAIFVARGFQPRGRGPAPQTTVTQGAPPVASSGREGPSGSVAEAGPKESALHRTRPRGFPDTTTEIDALAPPRLDMAPLDIEALPTESIAVPQLDAIAPIAVEPLPANDERPMTNDQRP